MPRREEPDRVLATVLFTDIVGSTKRAAEVGDQRWREQLRSHHAKVRRELQRFGGRELDTAGDGFLAIFGSPGSAVAAAIAIVREIQAIGLHVRTGLHMGECTLMDGDIGGITVHIGARVAALADADEVLVSSTVRDALAGSGVAFQDRGLRELKGVPGEWRVFAVGDHAHAPVPTGAAYHKSFPAASARRRPLMVRAGVAVALVVVVVAAVLFVRSRSPASLLAIPANNVGQIDAADGSIGAALPTQGDQPVALAYLNGSVWVANALSRTVTRIDTVSHEGKTVALAGPPAGMAAGFGVIWVLESSGLVELIDAGSSQITGHVQVPSNSHAIASGPGAIWVSNSADGTVTQINPSTVEIVNTISVGKDGSTQSPGALAASDTSVWVTDELGPNLWQIDTDTQHFTESASVTDVPSAIAIAPDGGVWVSMATANAVARVDPATGQSVTVPVGSQPGSLTVGEGSVWVADAGTRQVTQIDLASRTVVRNIDIGAVPSAVVTSAGSVWVAAAPS